MSKKKRKISKENDDFETKLDEEIQKWNDWHCRQASPLAWLGLISAQGGWRVSVSCFDENCMCSQSVTSCDAVKNHIKRHLIPVMPFSSFSELQTQSYLPIRCHTSSVNANSSPGNSFDSIPSELRGVRQAAHHQTPALEAPIQSTGSAGLRKLVEAHLSPTPPKKTRLEGWR